MNLVPEKTKKSAGGISGMQAENLPSRPETVPKTAPDRRQRAGKPESGSLIGRQAGALLYLFYSRTALFSQRVPERANPLPPLHKTILVQFFHQPGRVLPASTKCDLNIT